MWLLYFHFISIPISFTPIYAFFVVYFVFLSLDVSHSLRLFCCSFFFTVLFTQKVPFHFYVVSCLLCYLLGACLNYFTIGGLHTEHFTARKRRRMKQNNKRHTEQNRRKKKLCMNTQRICILYACLTHSISQSVSGFVYSFIV